ncbi:MAG: HK97 family phage prohead protease [Acidobacteriota bacterium]
MNSNREFQFEVKMVSDEGQFEGLGAVYGNVDQGGDRINTGAFTKTLKETKGRVPLLADHRIPIGAAYVTDSPSGLIVKGVLNLDKEVSRDTLSDLRFYRDNKIPYGMSIGYSTIKSEPVNGVRVLRELKLREMSVTLFPMNEAAQVQRVKHNSGDLAGGFKFEFINALREVSGKRALTYDEFTIQQEIKALFR